MDPVIDLSHWNEREKNATINDLEAAMRAGLQGIIHKCTEGSSYVDPEYAPRRALAEKHGLLWGAYHFLRPGNMEQQADWFLCNAGELDGLLLAADHEDGGVSLEDVKDFLVSLVVRTGRQPVLYSGNVIEEQLGGRYDEELSHYRLWTPQYTSAAAPTWNTATWPRWWLWQYTDKGTVPGIEGPVDLNRFGGKNLADEWWSGDDGDETPAQKVKIDVTVPDCVGIEITLNGATIFLE